MKETQSELDLVEDTTELDVVLEGDRYVPRYKPVLMVNQDGDYDEAYDEAAREQFEVELRREVPKTETVTGTSLVSLREMQEIQARVEAAWAPKRVKEVPTEERVQEILTRIAEAPKPVEKEILLPPGGRAYSLDSFLAQVKEVWEQDLTTYVSVHSMQINIIMPRYNWRVTYMVQPETSVEPNLASYFGHTSDEILAVFGSQESMNAGAFSLFRQIEIWLGDENNEMTGPYRGVGVGWITDESDIPKMKVRVTDPRLTNGLLFIEAEAEEMPLDCFTLSHGQYAYSSRS